MREWLPHFVGFFGQWVLMLLFVVGMSYLYRREKERRWREANEFRERAEQAKAEMEAFADQLRDRRRGPS